MGVADLPARESGVKMQYACYKRLASVLLIIKSRKIKVFIGVISFPGDATVVFKRRPYDITRPSSEFPQFRSVTFSSSYITRLSDTIWCIYLARIDLHTGAK